MSYAVKEIYYTLQGEGMNAGRPAVFLRFAGCNLWSGQEADRLVDRAAADPPNSDGILGASRTHAPSLRPTPHSRE